MSEAEDGRAERVRAGASRARDNLIGDTGTARCGECQQPTRTDPLLLALLGL